MTNEEIVELLDGTKTIAVIGASNNEEKYGYKIYRQLKKVGFKIYPINPRNEQIQGDKSYENLYQLPEKVDVLNFVVPPKVSVNITKTAIKLGYKIFWYQPGSYDREVLELHKGQSTRVVSDRCLLIESSEN